MVPRSGSRPPGAWLDTLADQRSDGTEATDEEAPRTVHGPLGDARSLPPEIGSDSGQRWGYVPTDQRRARRAFWILFGVILAINALVALTILILRAAS